MPEAQETEQGEETSTLCFSDRLYALAREAETLEEKANLAEDTLSLNDRILDQNSELIRELEKQKKFRAVESDCLEKSEKREKEVLKELREWRFLARVNAMLAAAGWLFLAFVLIIVVVFGSR